MSWYRELKHSNRNPSFTWCPVWWPIPISTLKSTIWHILQIDWIYRLSLHSNYRRKHGKPWLRPETVRCSHHIGERTGVEKDVLQRLALKTGNYFVVSAHREENVDVPGNLNTLLETLNALASEYNYPVVVSTHPRTRKRLDERGPGAINPQVRFEKAFGFFDYIRLQMEAHCVLSDSGTLTEEASLLNLPAIAIRNTHERPEGMDTGTLVMSGLTKERVLEAVRVVTVQHDRKHRVAAVPADYVSEQVSKQVLRVVMSYVDYVNRTVWSESSSNSYWKQQ